MRRALNATWRLSQIICRIGMSWAFNPNRHIPVITPSVCACRTTRLSMSRLEAVTGQIPRSHKRN